MLDLAIFHKIPMLERKLRLNPILKGPKSMLKRMLENSKAVEILIYKNVKKLKMHMSKIMIQVFGGRPLGGRPL